MKRLLIVIGLSMVAGNAAAQTTTLSFSSSDFTVTPAFNDVGTFSFTIIINSELTAGTVYSDPELVSVTYSVSGDLPTGTPSGFASFALQRDISGADFYAQGSSLSFEINANAVLSDGLQIAELAGAGSDVVFTFNGREINNGRFHPALLQLQADGNGRIQNSDNIISIAPPLQVNFGDEYVTDLLFDAGNLTVVAAAPAPPGGPGVGQGGGGGAAPVVVLTLLGTIALRRRRVVAAGTAAG